MLTLFLHKVFRARYGSPAGICVSKGGALAGCTFELWPLCTWRLYTSLWNTTSFLWWRHTAVAELLTPQAAEGNKCIVVLWILHFWTCNRYLFKNKKLKSPFYQKQKTWRQQIGSLSLRTKHWIQYIQCQIKKGEYIIVDLELVRTGSRTWHWRLAWSL